MRGGRTVQVHPHAHHPPLGRCIAGGFRFMQRQLSAACRSVLASRLRMVGIDRSVKSCGGGGIGSVGGTFRRGAGFIE